MSLEFSLIGISPFWILVIVDTRATIVSMYFSITVSMLVNDSPFYSFTEMSLLVRVVWSVACSWVWFGYLNFCQVAAVRVPAVFDTSHLVELGSAAVILTAVTTPLPVSSVTGSRNPLGFASFLERS